MRITIEDLEALKELSDELEENHMETEKQLNEDLGASNITSDRLSHLILLNRGEGNSGPRTSPQSRKSRRDMCRL